MPTIQTKLHIKAPIDVSFDLARNIDIHAQSTSQTHERAIEGVTSGLIELGQSVTWEAIHFGIKQRLTAKITEFDYPRRFVDEQIRGAFKRFLHCHEFTEADGGTLMIDTFNYDAPFGLLGRLADKLFLERYMEKFLMNRNLYIKQTAEQEQIYMITNVGEVPKYLEVS